MTAFKINQGLHFEDRGVLLPWGAMPDELRAIERPALERPNHSQGFAMFWRGGLCFGGLEAQCVSTLFGNPKWPQERLQGLRIQFKLRDTDDIYGTKEFEHHLSMLSHRFGEPVEFRESKDPAPWPSWNYVGLWRWDNIVFRQTFSNVWGIECYADLFLRLVLERIVGKH